MGVSKHLSQTRPGSSSGFGIGVCSKAVSFLLDCHDLEGDGRDISNSFVTQLRPSDMLEVALVPARSRQVCGHICQTRMGRSSNWLCFSSVLEIAITVCNG